MEVMNASVLAFEIIGTIAFAASGAMVGIGKKMDLLGIIILGLTAAIGGGTIRDIIIGNTPVQAVLYPNYSLIAIATAVVMFHPLIRNEIHRHEAKFNLLLFIMDTVGLGVFTVVGIASARGFVSEYNFFLLVFVGTVTGVGGGVIRDVLAGDVPFIFVKHFYATASIIGAAVCTFLWDRTGENIAMTSGAAVVIILRILAAKYRWKLPRA